MGVNFILARQPRATWRDEPCSDRRSRERRAEADADGSKLIYFLGGDGTPVKIGFSVDPDARRRNLQSAHWCKLSVLATVVGTEADEKAYHVRFAAHRLEGEWFARCPEIEAEIARLKAEAEV